MRVGMMTEMGRVLASRRYKRSPTLGVINIFDGRNLLTTLDNPPFVRSVVRRKISVT